MRFRFLRSSVSTGLDNVLSALKSKGHNVLKLNISRSTYSGRNTDKIINWGRHDRGSIERNFKIYNDPSAVAIAANKKATFDKLSLEGLGAFLPPFTTSKRIAEEWIREGFVVFCRELLVSSQGRGIQIAQELGDLVDCPLYTRYVPVDRELRVHVFNGNVIDFSQKKKISRERREELGMDDPNGFIRNLENGWIFAREGVGISEDVKEVCINCVQKVGLDFGAVDVIVSQGIPKVLEINTAPGVTGTTVEKYVGALENLI